MPGSNQEYKMCLKLETCRKKEKCLSDRTLCRLSSEKEFRLQGSSIQLSDFVHVQRSTEARFRHLLLA